MGDRGGVGWSRAGRVGLAAPSISLGVGGCPLLCGRGALAGPPGLKGRGFSLGLGKAGGRDPGRRRQRVAGGMPEAEPRSPAGSSGVPALFQARLGESKQTRLSSETFLRNCSTHIHGSCYHCSLFVRNSPQCLRECGSHPRCCASLRPFPNFDPQFQEGIPVLVSPHGCRPGP